MPSFQKLICWSVRSYHGANLALLYNFLIAFNNAVITLLRGDRIVSEV